MKSSASTMKVSVRKTEGGWNEDSKLYCIQDGRDYIFSLSNYSWSVAVRNSQDIEKVMKYGFSLDSQRTTLIAEMKEMMKELSPVKSIELER